MDGDKAEHITTSGFGGRAVVSFESRRAAEMASLIERHGGVPIMAPAVREVVLAENPAALAFAHALRERAFDAVLLFTGVGTRALVEEVAPVLDRAAFASALGGVRVIARGPKPAVALRELGVRDFVTVPEPNTWREVLAAVEALGGSAGALEGLRVAVQEHGAPSSELYAALAMRGAVVTAVPVYKWALPEDTTKLRAGLCAIAEGRVEIALFTTRIQVEHALAVAGEEGVATAVVEGLRRGVVASIGPVCSATLVAEGIAPDIEPEHPKMGHLVKAAAAGAGGVLEAKRGQGKVEG